MKTYLVGGAVRDKLLNYPHHERDWVVVGATTQEMLDQGYQQVGRDFPVFLHPRSQEEYALARTERKTGQGYTGFQCHSSPDVTLTEDLLRRDLTINAMAMDEHHELIDPYGGQQDLADRRLRHVSSAFSEDPVRILRVARFAARYHHLGFFIAEETLNLMTQMVDAGEAEHLVAERVWKEIHSALTTKSPEVFFQVLRDCGALKVLIPELDCLFGVPQPEKYHPEIDTGIHSLMSLQMATHLSDSVEVGYAALMHDLGKGLTPKADWPQHLGHENKGIDLIADVGERLKVPKHHTELAKLASALHTRCHRALEMRPAKLYDFIDHADALRRPERFADLLLVCEADAIGRTDHQLNPYPQAPFMQQVLSQAQSVKAEALVADGFKGKILGEKLREHRIAAIATLKTDKTD